MKWKNIFNGDGRLMDPATEGGDGGGGGGGGGGGAPDLAKDLEAANAKIAELEAKLKSPAPPAPAPDDTDPLRKKVADDRRAKEKQSSDAKAIEAALRFNLTVPSYLKEHADLLPSEMPEILKVAEKEKYDTAQEKSRALKVSLLGTYFSQQASVDALTPHQRTQLDDFLKLTKNGKEERADFMWENIFEPAIELQKKVRKAEEVGKARAGIITGTKSDNAYKDKLIGIAQRMHNQERK